MFFVVVVAVFVFFVVGFCSELCGFCGFGMFVCLRSGCSRHFMRFLHLIDVSISTTPAAKQPVGFR